MKREVNALFICKPPKIKVLERKIYGAFAAILIYGGIMNPASAFMIATEKITLQMLLGYYITGLPMDLVHAFGTALFLLIAAESMLEKLDRIKVKYGLVE